MRRAGTALLVPMLVTAAACNSSDGASEAELAEMAEAAEQSAASPPTVESTTPDLPPEVPLLTIDVAAAGAEISPLILGTNGDVDAAIAADVGFTLASWGGRTASRFNYVAGNASNGGAPADYRNRVVGPGGDAVAAFLAATSTAGLEARVAVPMLGWIASDSDPTSCSFPRADGTCGNGGGSSCQSPDEVSDPSLTSVESSPAAVAAWVGSLVTAGTAPRFIAFDNEPELWGIDHYDVHPTCSTYEEILLRYINHATAVRAVAPDAELLGPVMCCWFDYWRAAPGPADGSDQDFLSWFLTAVREYDESVGDRTLDVVDVHYSPQSDVLNEDVSVETAARRLRSTRSLYDPLYTDESWISSRIQFFPRLRHAIEAAYPRTPIAISEWRWGAEATVNGGLAIADVLGIFGREGAYLAAHSGELAPGSPGYLAFKMHGNYDSEGSRFGGSVVPVVVEGIDAYEELAAFAAYDGAAGVVRVMLINKLVDAAIELGLDVRSFEPAASARVFRLSEAVPDQITEEELAVTDEGPLIALPASSITLVEMTATDV